MRPVSLFRAFLVLIGCWTALTLFYTPTFLPSPWSTLYRFLEELWTGPLFLHLAISLKRVILGMGLGMATAVPLGWWLGQDPKGDRLFAPFIYLLYPVPKIALLPLFLLILGIGELSKILLISLILFFQVLVAMRDASKNIHPSFRDSLRSLTQNPWAYYRHVVAPASLPTLFTTLRLGLATSLAVLFLVETYATTEGLGYYMMDAMTRFEYTDLFAGLTAMSLLGATLFALLDFLEVRCCPWARPFLGEA